ncbi:[FeFe] hydrogenase H-cluster maturation GTPase HydF [Oscillospiraceae bacterium HV4-5-C5C]|nr:[FeFe] hydrogenase H-cluster maturation GTPase HydF [Oscillospiraceae bacterium HV4-5-C5C]
MAALLTPRSLRTHIGIFGRTNAGKSSLINALCGQAAAIVSDQEGTTTDPVYKSIELFPLGPCVLIDTAGLADHNKLGNLRRQKTLEVLNRCDMAIYVVDAARGLEADEEVFCADLRRRGLPTLLVWHKADQLAALPAPPAAIAVSSLNQSGIRQLLQRLSQLRPESAEPELLDGLVKAGDTVLLITPIDQSAPKGRLILPQQRILRDLLDLGAPALCVQPAAIPLALQTVKSLPALAITDSQAFGQVDRLLPQAVPLTSFSMLMARCKGDLPQLLSGIRQAASGLKDGDRVLVAEACTHHRQEDDIGRVKIPRWLQEKRRLNLQFDFTAGHGFPEDLTPYALVVHCGACMINRSEMQARLRQARQQAVPVVNYGILIAWATGVLPRALKPLGVDLTWPLDGPCPRAAEKPL